MKRKIPLFVAPLVLLFLAFLFLPTPTPEAIASTKETLSIPTINLENAPIEIMPLKNQDLLTPESSVGKYIPPENPNLTFLVAHLEGVFENLPKAQKGDQIQIEQKTYSIQKIEIHKKEEINMTSLLTTKPEKIASQTAPETKILILMTCAGTYIEKQDDFTHRLIIHAIML